MRLEGISARLCFGSELDDSLLSLCTHLGVADASSQLAADLCTRNVSNLPSAHMYFAGWPCQPDSSQGPRGRKLKNAPLSAVLTYVCEQKPLSFILENVAGFTRGRVRQLRWAKMLQLLELFYEVKFTHLSPDQVAGIPHHRNRLFLVGVRKHTRAATKFLDSWSWPSPVPACSLAQCLGRSGSHSWILAKPSMSNTHVRNLDVLRSSLGLPCFSGCWMCFVMVVHVCVVCLFVCSFVRSLARLLLCANRIAT